MRPAQTTDNELRFISNLGKYANTRASRYELLTGYLMGCASRTNWGGMDRRAILLHTIDSLRGEI